MKEIELSTKEMSTLLGVSDRSIRDFAERGLITRTGRGRFALVESVQLYTAHLREVSAGRGGEDATAELSRERARLAREQADNAALRNATLRRELVPANEVEREWSGILRSIRSRVLACTSRIRARLPHMTPHDAQTIDRELRDALSELADDQDNSDGRSAVASAAGAAASVGLDGEGGQASG